MFPFEPPDPQFESRTRESFARQKVMHLLGATLERISPGSVDIQMPFDARLVQQDGFVHAGIVATICDSACGYAAFTLTPAGYEVLSVEFKVNLMRPAIGERLVARGTVVKPGRTLTFTRGDVFAIRGGKETIVATMLNTIISRKLNEGGHDGE